MSTYTALLAETRSYLDESTAGDWTDAELKVWINHAYRDMGARLKQIEATASLTVSASTATVDLSTAGSGALLNQSSQVKRMSLSMNGNIYPLSRISIEKYTKLIEGGAVASGIPDYYVVWGNTLTLYPTPSASGTITCYYYNADPTELGDGQGETSTPSLPDFTHRLIPLFAAACALRKQGNHAEAQVFMGEYEEGIFEAEKLLSPVNYDGPSYVTDAVGYSWDE